MLCDFGLAEVLPAGNDTSGWSGSGTALYNSREKDLGSFGMGEDVWALGCVFWSVLRDSVCGEEVMSLTGRASLFGVSPRTRLCIFDDIVREMGGCCRTFTRGWGRDSDEKTHQELEIEFTRVLEMCFEVDITADKPDEKRCTSGRAAKEISRLLGVWDKATRERASGIHFDLSKCRLEAAKSRYPKKRSMNLIKSLWNLYVGRRRMTTRRMTSTMTTTECAACIDSRHERHSVCVRRLYCAQKSVSKRLSDYMFIKFKHSFMLFPIRSRGPACRPSCEGRP